MWHLGQPRAASSLGGTHLGLVWSMTILALGFLGSQAHSQPPCPPAPPSYQSLRYEEDYTFLHDPSCRTDVWDPVKYMPLNETGDWFLSLGGEARLRYEYFHNTQWGQGPQDDDGFLLQRYMVHADLHLDRYARLFVQLQSSLENGRNGGPRPTDEDALDLHQAFVDVAGAFGAQTSLTLRAGRQELQYGSQRLVSVREGPNARLSFDAVRLIARAGPWRIDGFVSRPVETDPGVFDDNPDETRAFWGVYAVAPLSPLPKGNTDLYYLGFEHEGARSTRGRPTNAAIPSAPGSGVALGHGSTISSSSTNGGVLATAPFRRGLCRPTAGTPSNPPFFARGSGLKLSSTAGTVIRRPATSKRSTRSFRGATTSARSP